jgi:hypothetical protein
MAEPQISSGVEMSTGHPFICFHGDSVWELEAMLLCFVDAASLDKLRSLFDEAMKQLGQARAMADKVKGKGDAEPR